MAATFRIQSATPLTRWPLGMGTTSGFRAVLDRYGPLIRSVVFSYADSDDERGDLYQEVCIRMLEKRAKYQERDSMGGWIRTVARHVARKLARLAIGT